MKNIVLLQKQDDGSILCQEITSSGISFMDEEPPPEDHGYWDKGETITLDEINEILDKER